MTKEMQALIEAAEAYIAEVDQIAYMPKTRHTLKAAISSAKAAEEGVETKIAD